MIEPITYEKIALHATVWLTIVGLVAMALLLARLGLAFHSWLERKGL